MQLRAGAGSARIKLNAKGVAMPEIAGAMLGPVTVQLVGSDTAECQQSVFSSGDISRNEAGRFSASVP